MSPSHIICGIDPSAGSDSSVYWWIDESGLVSQVAGPVPEDTLVVLAEKLEVAS